MWVKDDECSNIIEDVWALSTKDKSLDEIMHLIKCCGSKLTHGIKRALGICRNVLLRPTEP